MYHDRSDASTCSQDALCRAPEIRSVWRLGLREISLGARGIPKMSHLWLPLALLFQSDSTNDLRTELYTSFPLIVAVLCRVQFSILINDLSDSGADAAAGKKRWISLLPRPAACVIVLSFLVLGYAAVLLGSGSLRTILAYTVSVLLGMFYSLKPFRFKKRGALGLLVYALSATTIYVLVPWTWLDAGLWPLMFLVAAVGSDKWIQIHFHQVIDYSADLKHGTRTYAVHAGLDRARSTLKPASFTASLCLLGTTAYVVFLASHIVARAIVLLSLAAVMAASWVYTVRIRNRQTPNSSALVRELPWTYLGLTYLVFYVLPTLLFSFSAWQEPRIWILVVLSFLFLVCISMQSFRYQYR